ncbi:uncharacterized protein LOC142609015 [Castanea sativa]|uniref:uncharacterized protein LOC142609015 n=1 Tax=Castanea sativa TaxID=21020 RepID=UPI003F64D1AD
MGGFAPEVSPPPPPMASMSEDDDGFRAMCKFHREDAEAICRIPLSRRSILDSIIWLHNKNGKFSIKSAYKLARRTQFHGDRVEASSGCAFDRELEITTHALWECAVVQDIWAGSILKLQKGCSVFSDTLQLMEFLVDILTVEELELFWVQAWIIWNKRNCVVHGGQLKDPKCLNKRVEDFIQEFQQAQAQLTVSRIEQLSSKLWQPPPHDVYKLNFDAAVFSRLERTGIGAIIRNDKGEVMVAMFAVGPSAENSEEAELLACRRSLEFALNARFISLIIEGDNVNTIQAISSSLPNHSILGYVVDDIRHLIHGLHWARTNQIRRGGNTVAHVLA